MSEITPLYNADRKMRVAVLLSGSGSTADSLGQHVADHPDCGFEVVLYLADKVKKCGVLGIGEKYKTPAMAISRHNIGRYDLADTEREEAELEEFNSITTGILIDYDVDVVAMMGAGWQVDAQIYDRFLTINNHPGDLRGVGDDGQRAYKGWHEEPIMKAMLARERYLHVTVNKTIREMDEGDIFMVSDGVEVVEPIGVIEDLARDTAAFKKRAGEYQDKLKEVGDKVVMASTLGLIAGRQFQRNEYDQLFFRGERIPHGITYRESFGRN